MGQNVLKKHDSYSFDLIAYTIINSQHITFNPLYIFSSTVMKFPYLTEHLLLKCQKKQSQKMMNLNPKYKKTT